MFVLDVLPTGVPYLVEWWNVSAGVLFYCHFPDKLLTRDTVNGEQGPSAAYGAGTARGSASLIRFFLIILSQLKRCYRWALDAMEEWTMSYSDLIVVNSKFTMGEVERVCPSLFLRRKHGGETASKKESPIKADDSVDGNEQQTNQGDRVRVLYPAIESSLSKDRKFISNSQVTLKCDNAFDESKDATSLILSLNRFERKKNVALLLRAYDLLLERASQASLPCVLPPLMIAGGYDPLNVENVEHLAELRNMADEILRRYDLPLSTVVPPSSNNTESQNGLAMKITQHPNHLLQFATITFLPSVSNAKRNELLSSASTLCYTPHREHFGIVPLEAMDAGVPVVAIRSGGPMETVVDGVTGYLVDYSEAESEEETADGGGALNNGNSTTSKSYNKNKTVKGYADAIAKIISNPKDAILMGRNGRKRVDEIFGMEIFRKQWWDLLLEAQKRGKKRCYIKTVGRGYCVSSTIVRSFCELAAVVLLAVGLTWSMTKAGWLEENKGIVGTIKVWLLGRDEL